MDQGVDRRPAGVLVHPHAPQAGDAEVFAREEIGQKPDVLRRDAGDLLHLVGRVVRERLLHLVKGDRFALEGLLIVRRAEGAERVDELLVVGAALEEEVCDPVREGEIGLRAKED